MRGKDYLSKSTFTKKLYGLVILSNARVSLPSFEQCRLSLNLFHDFWLLFFLLWAVIRCSFFFLFFTFILHDLYRFYHSWPGNARLFFLQFPTVHHGRRIFSRLLLLTDRNCFLISRHVLLNYNLLLIFVLSFLQNFIQNLV